MKVLVIGGTLFIGRFLVRRLLEEGHHVAVLHRKAGHALPAEVENLTADRNDAASVKRAVAGRRFDVVFDNVYDWERGTTADQVVDTVRACGVGLQRYIFMSSVAAFAQGLNHEPDDPLAPDDHPNPYYRNKASSERALFRLHAEEGLPAVTLRPPFVYGPDNPFYREAFFWDRLEDDRPIIIPNDGSRLMQFVYVQDVVSACMKAMTEPAAVGQAFHLGNDHPITQVEAVQAVATAAGKTPRFAFIPRQQIATAGGSAMGPEKLYFGEYWDVPPITMVVEKTERLLGVHPTDFAAGLKETFAWYKTHGKRRLPDYSFEDQLLT